MAVPPTAICPEGGILLPYVMRRGMPTIDKTADAIEILLRRNERDENGPSYTRVSSFSSSLPLEK